MTGHTTPEHLVRPEWVGSGALMRLTCTLDGCTWHGEVGYRGLTGLDLTPELQREIYRAAVQAAAVHGWPDLDHLPGDGILARHTGCGCAPDPTASRGFWDRIKEAIA